MDVYSFCSMYIIPLEPFARLRMEQVQTNSIYETGKFVIYEPSSWTSGLIGWNPRWAVCRIKSFGLTRSITKFAQDDLWQWPRFILASEIRGKLIFFLHSKPIRVDLACFKTFVVSLVTQHSIQRYNSGLTHPDRDTHCLDILLLYF